MPFYGRQQKSEERVPISAIVRFIVFLNFKANVVVGETAGAAEGVATTFFAVWYELVS